MWINRQNTVFHELWQKEFRMGPITLEYLLKLIAENREKSDTKFRKAIAVEKQLAVALWRLLTENFRQAISKVFGIGKSTVTKIVQKR